MENLTRGQMRYVINALFNVQPPAAGHGVAKS
jgi:hypothetical protein